MLKPFLTSIGLRGRFLDDFRRSKRRQASHKSRQEGTKSRQDGPKSAPRAAKRAPRAAKTAPSSTKTPSRGLREPFWLHSRPPGTISEAFWATFRSKFGRMFGGRWLLFLRSSSSSFSFACVRCFFLSCLHLLPRLCSDRAGKPGEKPQARTRSGSRHSRLRSAPSSKRRGGGAQRRREAPTRMPGLAVSLLLMSRSWRFLFFLVLLVRLRLQCLLRSSRSCIACLACGSRSERASRSMIARFLVPC